MRHDHVCDNHYLCHLPYEDSMLQTVAGKAVLSSILHALCHNDNTQNRKEYHDDSDHRDSDHHHHSDYHDSGHHHHHIYYHDRDSDHHHHSDYHDCGHHHHHIYYHDRDKHEVEKVVDHQHHSGLNNNNNNDDGPIYASQYSQMLQDSIIGTGTIIRLETSKEDNTASQHISFYSSSSSSSSSSNISSSVVNNTTAYNIYNNNMSISHNIKSLRKISLYRILHLELCWATDGCVENLRQSQNGYSNLIV